MRIYLADLTHTGMIVASNTFPLGVGLIGANIKKHFPDAYVELFKYPQDLDRALCEAIPDLIGFSNYSWNCNLGMEYARRIKRDHPSTIVIAGGPNYGSTEEEHEDYWNRFPFLDYYIVKEGEQAVVSLLSELSRGGFSKHPDTVLGTHTLRDARIIKNKLPDRIDSLDTLASPYTTGLMDKFFDDVLIPMTHTTRGCPFKCSFCTEGTAYYDRVAKRTTLSEDLEYIGQRKGNIQDLYITDANFGMFKEDEIKARDIAAAQAKYNWPQYIHVSGGKNHKERLLNVASIIGGAMGVAASLQSTDPTVLANVRRSNISTEQITEVAKKGSRIDANTYAEIILNLPGDTVAAHTRSLRDAVNSGLSYLRMYQLILLPETDMNTQEQRAKFGLKTMWRIMPRCFGTYPYQDEQFACAEIEEIVIAQDSMTFDEYVQCRELDLTIEIVHNTSLFRELFGLCQAMDVEWFSLIMAFHAQRRHFLPALYDTFRENTIKPLWPSRDEALTFAKNNVGKYIAEELGTNELFNAKAYAFFELQEELHECIYHVAKEFFPNHSHYLAEAKRFSLGRKADLLNESGGGSVAFSYDFLSILGNDFIVDPHKYRRPVQYEFVHDQSQRKTIAQLLRQYGRTQTGLGRIMLRAHIKKLFRQVSAQGQVTDKGFEASYRRASNLYGD